MCLEKFRASKFLKGSLSFTICPINSVYEKLGVMEYLKSLNFNQHSYWNAHFLIVLEHSSSMKLLYRLTRNTKVILVMT